MSKLSAVTAEDHVQGATDARYTLVEYGDFQCPTCGEAYPIVKRLQKHFGEDLRFVFRNFPLEQHQFAEAAAETAEFAASQGKFWEMHDALFENQRRFDEELFPKLATEVGLKAEGLEKALEEETFADRVERDVESGDAAGVQGTPSFYIDGRLHQGSFDYESLLSAIQSRS